MRGWGECERRKSGQDEVKFDIIGGGVVALQ